MKTKLNGIEVNFRYRFNDNKDKVVLLLHGWGGSLNSFRGLENFLVQNNYSVINLDFPGFGNSDLPGDDFTLDDYEKIIVEMLEYLHLEKVNVVAHSFGGRVALLLASSTNYVDKLVLVDSAGIKPKFSITKFFRQKRYKFLKFLAKKGIIKRDLSNFGSEDYRALPDQLKPVFVRIVSRDLTECLGKIKCPTLIIWGEKDTSTPLYMAKKMNKKIADSGLVVFKNAGHFSYLDYHDDFLIIVDNFLK